MYDALGFRFSLACPDQASAAYMAHILSGLEAAPSDGAVEFALRAPPAGAQAGPGPDEVGHVVGTVNLRAIGASAGSLLLHPRGASLVRPTDSASRRPPTPAHPPWPWRVSASSR